MGDNLLFIISPFTPDRNPVYLAVAVASTAAGLHAERVKDMRGDYPITDLMLAMIRRARLVVAGLTHERQNVYFELGYARGLRQDGHHNPARWHHHHPLRRPRLDLP